MKRNRQHEQGVEDEPLSKRINNLHLDNPGFSSSNPSPDQMNDACSMDSEDNYSSSSSGAKASTSYYRHNESMNSNNNNECVINNNMLASKNMLVSNQMAMASNSFHSQEVMNKMIESRDMPDSLCTSYPMQNPTLNSHYYNFNRTLHAVHLEKLRRIGKIS